MWYETRRLAARPSKGCVVDATTSSKASAKVWTTASNALNDEACWVVGHAPADAGEEARRCVLLGALRGRRGPSALLPGCRKMTMAAATWPLSSALPE